jgi:Flp pilus assembly pilin Flp
MTRLNDGRDLLHRLVFNEQGGEVIEYALIAGAVVVLAVTAAIAFGQKLLARWVSGGGSLSGGGRGMRNDLCNRRRSGGPQ